MTKWFDTNYHFIVPEVTANTEFELNSERILSQLKEAQAQGVNAKPVIIGPVTYLYLSKEKDDSNRLDLLDKILPVYSKLLEDRKSTRLNSSHVRISYAVFCLKKKKKK